MQVAWYRGSENRFFEYIKRRDPPYQNFSLLGADIDVSIPSATDVWSGKLIWISLSESWDHE